MNRTWQALAQEADLSAEHIAIGVTALGEAHYSTTAYYAQAFFALSVGFERSCKLALVVDHALEHGGTFPDIADVRRYGHDLRGLLGDVERLRRRMLPGDSERALPDSAIHNGIVRTLGDFAMNVTRYYNLDLVTGNPRAAGVEGPISAWWNRVTAPILAVHYKPHHRQRHERAAYDASSRLGPYVIVHSHAETGEPIDDLYDVTLRNAMIQFARPWERMYVLQIARFLGRVLSQLGYQRESEDIPYFSEFFAVFNNADSYFRRRKTWSIHR